MLAVRGSEHGYSFIYFFLRSFFTFFYLFILLELILVWIRGKVKVRVCISCVSTIKTLSAI